MTDFVLGQQLDLAVAIRTADGAVATAADVTLRVQRPDRSITPEPVTVDGNTHKASIVLDQAGNWKRRWDSTNPVAVLEESWFVPGSPFPLLEEES